MGSANPPEGAGWFKLSEQTYINNTELLKKNTQVYKGRHLIDGEWRDIAVKLISYDEKSLEEVKLQLKIEDHPNIIQLYDANVIHHGIIPHIYIAMELCSQTLKDFIEERKRKPVDFELYFLFAKQVVSAVAHIHRYNILHRDLKLENILLTSTKDNVRVADFGLSKQLLEGHSVATASFRGLGTDGYRAPELLHEKPEASFRSDSFSLGIVLAMLFSNGQHPFGPDPSRWRTNITDNKGQDLSHILRFNDPYSGKRALLVDLVEQCLQYSPRERPTPEQMLRHGFFSGFTAERQVKTAANKEPLQKMTTDFQSMSATGGSSEKKSYLFSAPIGDTNAMSDDDSTEDNEALGDPIDQYLKIRKKKVKRLENDLAKAIKSGQANHLQILAELKTLSQVDDLDIILPLAEYELVNKKNDSCIEKVRHVIFEAGSRSALDVRQKGYSLQEQGDYVQSMILYIVAHELHKSEGKFSPDTELKWIYDRVTDISSAIHPLLDSGSALRNAAKNYGLQYMLKLTQELRAVDGATPSVKALREVGCLVNVTGHTNHIREYDTCIQYGEGGISAMRQQFGENVIHYKNYAAVLNNIGNAYGNKGQYAKSQDCYAESIKVKSQAQDYENEAEREKDIADTRTNSQNTHGKMRLAPLSAQ